MVRVLTLTFFAAIFCLVAPAQAADHSVYTDGLQNSWENWSWADTSSSATPVHNGSTSLAVTADAWEAAYFHNSSVDASLYTNLVFWIHGGAAGGQRLLVQGISNGEPREFVELPNLSANTWQQITVSLSQLGVAADPDFDGFWIQDRSGGTQPTFYLDDITFVAGRNPGTPTNSATAVITIDAGKGRRPISDLIYGVAFASSNQLQQLNVPLNRSGGNPESRYNWQLNAHNRGFD
ncbi:MAG TPA: hypothetical protein VFG14_06730, partial [Chthoniobacteraceae bacterium]|nr:hypothetical protein [Chthoniobacteraceae bacterium]